jgi:triphosphoribosyl-dephospho-CoA synthase
VIVTLEPRIAPRARSSAEHVGHLAAACLKLEVATYPKPGLVSHVDSGAHHDMDAALLVRSADALAPFFTDLALAGAAGADMDGLRPIGIAAERASLAATAGVNAHRGAIFGVGLLCAAAGFREASGMHRPLGVIVADRWGAAILSGPVPLRSHGAEAARRYGAGGARVEAACGLCSIYVVALPALRAARAQAPHDDEAARVQACMALIAAVEDTNLLHRGGADGLDFARAQAAAFLAGGGVAGPGWRERAIAIHRAFVARNLSPGGCGDLLAMTLFVDHLEY